MECTNGFCKSLSSNDGSSSNNQNDLTSDSTTSNSSTSTTSIITDIPANVAYGNVSDEYH